MIMASNEPTHHRRHEQSRNTLHVRHIPDVKFGKAADRTAMRLLTAFDPVVTPKPHSYPIHTCVNHLSFLPPTLFHPHFHPLFHFSIHFHLPPHTLPSTLHLHFHPLFHFSIYSPPLSGVNRPLPDAGSSHEPSYYATTSPFGISNPISISKASIGTFTFIDPCILGANRRQMSPFRLCLSRGA